MLSNLAIADILAKRREQVLMEMAQKYRAGELTERLALQAVVVMIAQFEIERDIERREKSLGAERPQLESVRVG